jgi:hypothetical protein
VTAAKPARLLPLGESRWELWPHLVVRSAGFPLSGLEPLADAALADAADRAADPADPGFRAAWAAAADRTGAAMAGITDLPAFRLALAWQNRRFLDGTVESLRRRAERGAPPNRGRRVRERSVAAYWQRYCAKNDTIGFFGPVAWAVAGRTATTTVTPGAGLVHREVVRYEGWAVEAVHRALVADLDLDLWTAPRRNPLVRVDASGVRSPGEAAETVSPVARRVLLLADGSIGAGRLAAEVAAALPGSSVPGVLAEMRSLRDRNWLLWRPELPAGPAPEEDLRRLLMTVTDPARRAAALERLDTLDRARDRVRSSWSDAEALPAALTDLDEAFTAVTGRDPTRNAGLAYGGRTLTYLECRRDVAVEVGADVIAALAPLGLVLDTVRWLTATIRDRFLPHVEAAFARVEAAPGGPPGLADLWMACLPLLATRLPAVVGTAVAELQERWWSVLGRPDGAAAVQRRTADLAAAVRVAFPATGSGWSEARWCCPDVMVAARTADDLRGGRFTVVLGEMHPATNSVDFVSMVPHHPAPAELLRYVDAAFPGPRLVVALPRESRPRITSRSHPALVRDQDHRLLLTPYAPVPAVGRVCPAADALVRRRDGRLVAVLPGGDEFDVLDVFAEAVKGPLVPGFDLLGRVPHPRVTVDGFVLARRTWTFAPEALTFAAARDEAARFHGARQWTRRHGIPRRVFLSSPLEPKPFLVDFAAPVSVSLLTSAARRAAESSHGPDPRALKVVEMLPEQDGTWLPDATGRTYTAELRFVAVDRPEQP